MRTTTAIAPAGVAMLNSRDQIIFVKLVSRAGPGYLEIHTREGCYYKSMRPCRKKGSATDWLL